MVYLPTFTITKSTKYRCTNHTRILWVLLSLKSPSFINWLKLRVEVCQVAHGYSTQWFQVGGSSTGRGSWVRREILEASKPYKPHHGHFAQPIFQCMAIHPKFTKWWSSKYVDVSKNKGTAKWMVYNEKPYWNGWFGGTPIFGNTHVDMRKFACGLTRMLGSLMCVSLLKLAGCVFPSAKLTTGLRHATFLIRTMIYHDLASKSKLSFLGGS